MRIATWNLAKPSRPRAALQAQAMREVGAAVWILTETNIDGRLGTEFERHVASVPDAGQPNGTRWTAICSRHELDAVPLQNDPTRTACAIVTIPDRTPLLVYGTVLPWVGSQWNDLPSAGGASFIAALSAQAAEWKSLQATYPDHDFCVAGDFNQDLNKRRYCGTAKCRAALQSALMEAGLTCVTGGEHDPVVAAQHGPLANIDHLCFSSPLAPRCRLPASVWRNRAGESASLSDHFGVWVDVP